MVEISKKVSFCALRSVLHNLKSPKRILSEVFSFMSLMVNQRQKNLSWPRLNPRRAFNCFRLEASFFLHQNFLSSGHFQLSNSSRPFRSNYKLPSEKLHQVLPSLGPFRSLSKVPYLIFQTAISFFNYVLVHVCVFKKHWRLY